MRRYLIWGLASLLVAAALISIPYLYLQKEMAPFTFASSDDAPTSTAAMVLGASVYQNGDLSPVLKARADTAAKLYEVHKVAKILVSGDNSKLSHNEVNPVGKYLESLGIPKEDIFLDHAGFDTYSSMYRAKEVFDVRFLTIVSQSFHLPRALFAARMLGIDAVGVEAPGESTLYNVMREMPATVKAMLDLLGKRVPEYLGEQYPITGDGSATWADATTTPEVPLH